MDRGSSGSLLVGWQSGSAVVLQKKESLQSWSGPKQDSNNGKERSESEMDGRGGIQSGENEVPPVFSLPLEKNGFDSSSSSNRPRQSSARGDATVDVVAAAAAAALSPAGPWEGAVVVAIVVVVVVFVVVVAAAVAVDVHVDVAGSEARAEGFPAIRADSAAAATRCSRSRVLRLRAPLGLPQREE